MPSAPSSPKSPKNSNPNAINYARSTVLLHPLRTPPILLVNNCTCSSSLPPVQIFTGGGGGTDNDVGVGAGVGVDGAVDSGGVLNGKDRVRARSRSTSNNSARTPTQKNQTYIAYASAASVCVTSLSSNKIYNVSVKEGLSVFCVKYIEVNVGFESYTSSASNNNNGSNNGGDDRNRNNSHGGGGTESESDTSEEDDDSDDDVYKGSIGADMSQPKLSPQSKARALSANSDANSRSGKSTANNMVRGKEKDKEKKEEGQSKTVPTTLLFVGTTNGFQLWDVTGTKLRFFYTLPALSSKDRDGDGGEGMNLRFCRSVEVMPYSRYHNIPHDAAVDEDKDVATPSRKDHITTLPRQASLKKSVKTAVNSKNKTIENTHSIENASSTFIVGTSDGKLLTFKASLGRSGARGLSVRECGDLYACDDDDEEEGERAGSVMYRPTWNHPSSSSSSSSSSKSKKTKKKVKPYYPSTITGICRTRLLSSILNNYKRQFVAHGDAHGFIGIWEVVSSEEYYDFKSYGYNRDRGRRSGSGVSVGDGSDGDSKCLLRYIIKPPISEILRSSQANANANVNYNSDSEDEATSTPFDPTSITSIAFVEGGQTTNKKLSRKISEFELTNDKIVACLANGTIRIYDFNELAPSRASESEDEGPMFNCYLHSQFFGHMKCITGLSVYPNFGTGMFATVGEDERIRVWKVIDCIGGGGDRDSFGNSLPVQYDYERKDSENENNENYGEEEESEMEIGICYEDVVNDRMLTGVCFLDGGSRIVAGSYDFEMMEIWKKIQ